MALSSSKNMILSCCVGFLVLSGCSGSPEAGSQDIEGFSAQQIFDRAEFEMGQQRPKEAVEFYADVERLYPYSELAKRAVIMQAFANHQAGEYQEARNAAERYITYYPADDDAAYAQYILALSYYDQIEDVGRDQAVTINALQAFRVLIEQYPDSEYTKSAELKFDLAYDHLAGKEMEVGRYYLKRKHYGAAINRFRKVVEDFQTSSYTAEALHRLVEAYISLGLVNEAQTAGAILGHNFQSTTWYEKSYALLNAQGLKPSVIGTGWLQKVHRQVIQGRWL